MQNPTDTQPTVTWELVIEILDALDRAGFRKSASDQYVGRAIGMITPLARAYAGDSDA